MDPKAQVVHLKTQLVSEGHTRFMLAETDLMTLRIHCYAPGIGENALHAHTKKEDHIFVVLDGMAQFNTERDGQTVLTATKNRAVVLPAGSSISSAIPARRRWSWRASAPGRTRPTSGSIPTVRRFQVVPMSKVWPNLN